MEVYGKREDLGESGIKKKEKKKKEKSNSLRRYYSIVLYYSRGSVVIKRIRRNNGRSRRWRTRGQVRATGFTGVSAVYNTALYKNTSIRMRARVTSTRLCTTKSRPEINNIYIYIYKNNDNVI